MVSLPLGMAMYDLCAKSAGVPVWQLFGEQRRGRCWHSRRPFHCPPYGFAIYLQVTQSGVRHNGPVFRPHLGLAIGRQESFRRRLVY
jgi:hypothetical protein